MLGLRINSNDNARGSVFIPIFEEFVSFAPVGAVDDGAEFTAVGAKKPSIVVWLLGAVVWGAVAVGVGVANTPVGFAGLIGETGLATFVGFVIDFVQVFCVVIHEPLHTGCP